MFIDHEKELAYLALPKTGSYSIHDYFGDTKNHPEPILHHMSAELMVAMYSQTVDYFKFAFVRNPWDKFVSVYHDFTNTRGREYSGHLTTHFSLLSEFKDFEDCCRNIKHSPWRHNVFFKPQVSFLHFVVGSVDFVGKFECLQEDFDRVCGIVGLPQKPLKHLNNGQYHHGYRKYYTAETAALVEELYAEDVREFGYEF
jgi:chondroitin 4-sulfotransferase 11